MSRSYSFFAAGQSSEPCRTYSARLSGGRIVLPYRHSSTDFPECSITTTDTGSGGSHSTITASELSSGGCLSSVTPCTIHYPPRQRRSMRATTEPVRKSASVARISPNWRPSGLRSTKRPRGSTVRSQAHDNPWVFATLHAAPRAQAVTATEASDFSLARTWPLRGLDRRGAVPAPRRLSPGTGGATGPGLVGRGDAISYGCFPESSAELTAAASQVDSCPLTSQSILPDVAIRTPEASARPDSFACRVGCFL